MDAIALAFTAVRFVRSKPFARSSPRNVVTLAAKVRSQIRFYEGQLARRVVSGTPPRRRGCSA